MQEKNLKTANLFRNIAKYGLLFFGVGVFFFALIMGAQDSGGGISGLFKNLPNTLPWAALLIASLVGWKNELIGGLLTTILGIGLVWFFNFSGPNFWMFTFVLTLIVPLLGSCFLVSWYLRRNQQKSLNFKNI